MPTRQLTTPYNICVRFERIQHPTMMMKLTILACFLPCYAAFAPHSSTHRSTGSTKLHQMSNELDLLCEAECAIEKYPNLPESVHPGVLSGKAMMDLLLDAKAKGES
jgi:hypothetical protein